MAEKKAEIGSRKHELRLKEGFASGVADWRKQQKISVMVVCRGILLPVLCAGAVLAGLPLAHAQQATTATLPEPPESVEATPLPVPERPRSKPTLEILVKPQHQKPARVAEHTSHPSELATPAPIVEKKTDVKKRATLPPQPEATASPASRVMSLATARAIAVKARIPDYPYEGQRTNITGSGVCLMRVEMTTGKVTGVTMEQSTGNDLLDKVTTDAFRKWRFKPGTVSEVRVPITYE